MNVMLTKVLLLFLLTFTAWKICSAAPTHRPSLSSPFEKTLVRVNNDLGDDLKYTIHCKSRDDDLGVHDIADGQYYEWSFRINFAHTTLFFCGVQSSVGSGVFVLFNANREFSRCGSFCVWDVTKDGIVGFNTLHQPYTPDLVLPWQKKKGKMVAADEKRFVKAMLPNNNNTNNH